MLFPVFIGRVALEKQNFLRAILFGFLFSGCLAPASSSNRLAAPATGSSDSASVSGAVYFAVDTAYENTTDFERMGVCSIPNGSALTTQNCTIRIPEGQLYFSDVKFTFGSSSGFCSQIVFYPHFYLGSQNAAFTPHWDPDAPVITCNDNVVTGLGSATAGPVAPECYNGAAKEIVGSDFPVKYRGKYFLPGLGGGEKSFTVKSGNSLGQRTNRWIANLNPNAAVDDPGFYVSNTMRPYRVLCVDKWGETQKQLNIYIADDDLEAGEDPAGPYDTYDDWEEN